MKQTQNQLHDKICLQSEKNIEVFQKYVNHLKIVHLFFLNVKATYLDNRVEHEYQLQVKRATTTYFQSRAQKANGEENNSPST